MNVSSCARILDTKYGMARGNDLDALMGSDGQQMLAIPGDDR
jgi:hypothetical protein